MSVRKVSDLKSLTNDEIYNGDKSLTQRIKDSCLEVSYSTKDSEGDSYTYESRQINFERFKDLAENDVVNCPIVLNGKKTFADGITVYKNLSLSGDLIVNNPQTNYKGQLYFKNLSAVADNKLFLGNSNSAGIEITKNNDISSTVKIKENTRLIIQSPISETDNKSVTTVEFVKRYVTEQINNINIPKIPFLSFIFFDHVLHTSTTFRQWAPSGATLTRQEYPDLFQYLNTQHDANTLHWQELPTDPNRHQTQIYGLTNWYYTINQIDESTGRHEVTSITLPTINPGYIIMAGNNRNIQGDLWTKPFSSGTTTSSAPSGSTPLAARIGVYFYVGRKVEIVETNNGAQKFMGE